MTVTQRKPQHLPDEIQTVNEPGVQYSCDSCACDLTHTIRIKCADPVCQTDAGVDICPSCFCAGKEFAKHKRGHAYRIIEINSYPIFTDDWGADEELLLITGIQSQGIGNWKKIAEHIGTRTKEEVEKHYHDVYISSPNWPMPPMDMQFDVDPEEFQARKRRRIAAMNAVTAPTPKAAPVSAPAVHEIGTFLPGRLEFEHELDNDAEDLVKDLEFGICLEYGGDQIMEDENDLDVKARLKWEEERQMMTLNGEGSSLGPIPLAGPPNGTLVQAPTAGKSNGTANGTPVKTEENEDEAVEEQLQPPPIESKESLSFKLTMLEMYIQRVERRWENKVIMFERGLLDYKKMQASDKKRPREERELVQRLRPFARLQTAEDYEAFVSDILYESILRKRIQELQHYRRLGLTTAADIEKYEVDLAKRMQSQAQARAPPGRDYYSSDRLQSRASGRQSSGPDPRRSTTLYDSEGRKSRESTPKPGVPGAPSISTGGGSAPPARRQPAPLNLANSPSVHLLTPPEQLLCSQLRILPKPYLVIKETLVREYARRGGKLRRREARDLVKIDVNKTSRVWDFLVQTGLLKITIDPPSQHQAQSAASTATTSTTPAGNLR
ncbi:hypothetical protein AX16_007884 [Volvariella volvacea WC 439]|nr:hypothetical protein AX16_007884 [Volvariella volvacea WC 439]